MTTATIVKPVAMVAAVWLMAQMSVAAEQPARVDEGSAGGVGVTLKVGTLGFGGEATLGVNDYLGVRLGGNFFSYSDSQSDEDGEIQGDLELLTYSALLDIHPFGGGFRVSGGGMLNKNEIQLRANLDRTVEIDDQEFSLSDFKGEVTFEEMAPYLGIGYGNAVGADGRWHFSCDFGVMFQGEPKVSASATASNPAIQPIVDEALDREVADLQDDANAFKYYPVISAGVSFRF
jgi:hypothetical protein